MCGSSYCCPHVDLRLEPIHPSYLDDFTRAYIGWRIYCILTEFLFLGAVSNALVLFRHFLVVILNKAQGCWLGGKLRGDSYLFELTANIFKSIISYHRCYFYSCWLRYSNQPMCLLALKLSWKICCITLIFWCY